MNKKAYAFFLKKNRPRNKAAQQLRYFKQQIIGNKKTYNRKKLAKI
tara:strand:- start:39 stop:176 length:138 start_codon:yes stop_codon:yes gene_type:complete